MDEINTVYPLDELIEYERNINSLIEKSSSELVFNDSIIHAALIMSAILKKANSINMYCGKFSIFRNDFRDKLSIMLKDPVYDSVRDSEEFEKFNPYKKNIDALKSFFQKGGKMNVIIQKDISSLTRENIWHDFLEEYYQKNQIVFYEHCGDLKLYHFTVADNKMYRQESDEELRTAFACFNNTDTATKLNICFNILKKYSNRVDLN